MIITKKLIFNYRGHAYEEATLTKAAFTVAYLVNSAS